MKSILLTISLLLFGGFQHGKPLDLPRSFGTEADEDASEVIEFYGNEYEGEAFFFLLDTSGSMRGEKIFNLKLEVIESINQMSDRAVFGLVRFSHSVSSYRHGPVRATRGQKRAATEWVQGLRAWGTTHMLKGAKKVIDICRESRQARKTIIIVGDGLPSTPKAEPTLEGITDYNTERDQINTVLIQQPNARWFMERLAELNRGKFREVF